MDGSVTHDHEYDLKEVCIHCGHLSGKSEEWRSAAHSLLIALAKDNKYIVSDMVILFLDSAGFGLKDYSPLGGVFKRAAKAGIIKKIDQPKHSKQALWVSLIHPKYSLQVAPKIIIDKQDKPV